MTLSVRSDVTRLRKQLSDLESKQLPFAIAAAVNAVAFQAMEAERLKIQTSFKHPRPFTAKGVLVTQRATKADPVAVIDLRPEVARYLEPYEEGGEHVLPGNNWSIATPEGARVDAFGQLARGALKRLASSKSVFIGTVHGITGMWLRPVAKKGGKSAPLKLLVGFVPNRPVTMHLNLIDLGKKAALAAFPAALKDALSKAMASRK